MEQGDKPEPALTYLHGYNTKLQFAARPRPRRLFFFFFSSFFLPTHAPFLERETKLSFRWIFPIETRGFFSARRQVCRVVRVSRSGADSLFARLLSRIGAGGVVPFFRERKTRACVLRGHKERLVKRVSFSTPNTSPRRVRKREEKIGPLFFVFFEQAPLPAVARGVFRVALESTAPEFLGDFGGAHGGGAQLHRGGADDAALRARRVSIFSLWTRVFCVDCWERSQVAALLLFARLLRDALP